MVVKNYYKILGLETSHVSIDEIKTAYRQAAKKYHPDLNVGDSLAEEKIKDINEAYRILSVPSTKRKYDRTWNSKFGRGQKAFTSSQKGAIIDMFFGNIDNSAGKNETVKKAFPVKGENIETQLNVSIFDAFFGLDKKIGLKTVDGKTKTYSVKIPKGIRNGEKIRLIGQGKEGKNGGKRGDLLIKINIEDDEKFQLNGFDIKTDLPITPWEAALGVRASVKSIDDETKIYVPEGTQSGEKIRIPNKGYYINDKERGDLIVEIKIVLPKNLNSKEKELYKKLKDVSKFNPRA